MEQLVSRTVGLLVAILGLAGGCASTESATPPHRAARSAPEVFLSDLDVRALESDAVVAPAMVAVYAIEEDGGSTFDQSFSSQAGGSVNTLVRFTGAPMIDFKRIDSTPIRSPEFYNRMDRATTQITAYCLKASSCTKSPISYEDTVSLKFRTWADPLDNRYVIFLRIVGNYLTPAARQSNLLTIVGATAAAGAIGAAVVIALLPRDGAVATASVLDLKDGEIVWFKMKPISNSRSIPEMRAAMAALLDDLL